MVRPVSARLDILLQKTRDNLYHRLEQETGLSFSYETMSPSLFRSLKLRNLIILDSENKSVIARISDVSITYSLFQLLTGNLAGSIREIIIKNGTVTLDSQRHKKMLERFVALGKASDGNSSMLPGVLDSKNVLVKIQNLSIHWQDHHQRFAFLVSQGSATLGANGINFNLASSMNYERDILSDIGPISSNLTVTGAIDSQLENGSATFTMESLSVKNFIISRFALVTSYRSGVVQVNSVQDLQPVDIALRWDIPNESLFMSLECDRLFPLRWITFKDSNPILESIKNTILSGMATVSMSREKPLAYSVDMTADIPDSVYGGGRAQIQLDGDRSTLYSHALGVRGPHFDVMFTGLYNFREHIPEGLLSIRKFYLPGGDGITANLYIHRTKKGFEGTIPLLTINDAQYSSVSLVFNPKNESIMEFSLSADDISGRISASGSYLLGDKPFFEGYLAIDSLSLANTITMIHSVLYPDQQKPRKQLYETLEPFGLTTEVFFSSDFSQFSYNCTRMVIASAEKDGLYVLFSAKGNESSFDITDITISPDRFTVNGSIHAEFDLTGDVVFDTDLTINSIPYYFSGMYSDQTLSLYGDYSTAVSMMFNPQGGVSGVFRTTGFPLPIAPLLLSLSLDTQFSYLPSQGFNLSIIDASIIELQGNFPLDTRIRFSGNIENTGIFLHDVALYDRYSTVTGAIRMTMISLDDGSTQYDAAIDLSAEETKEVYRVVGRLVNSTEAFLEANAEITGFPCMRFAKNQTSTNLITLTASISGTPETLFGAAEITSLSYRFSESNFSASGALLLEDGLVSLYDTAVSWGGQTFSDVNATMSVNTLEAELSAHYAGILDSSPITAGLTATFSPVLPSTNPAGFSDLSTIDTFTIQAVADSVRWVSIAPKEPFPVTLIREPGITALYAGPDDAITGFLLDDGTVSVQAGGASPVTFTADGRIDKSRLSVSVRDFAGNLDKAWPFTNITEVYFYSGLVTGSVEIIGLMSDPEFYGEFQTSNIVVSSPDHLVEKFTPDPFVIKADGKTLSVQPFMIRSDKSEFRVDAVSVFDRWIPNNVVLNVDTIPGKPLLIATENPFFSAEGRASCNLTLSFSHDAIVVNGPASFDRGFFAIAFSEFSKNEGTHNPSAADAFVNIDLKVGKKVEFRWPTNDFPILRGLIQSDEPVKISYDGSRDEFSLKGFANLKGGELFYIKRSFYLRQGSISFNENQDNFDPMISLRAEIRERDEKGEQVRIILLVDNQPISSFTPFLYSDPPRSSVELMALLGQAATADSTQDTLLRDTIVTASDIFAQMGLFRTAENTVRDFLHLDIFSIRTLLIQNAIFRQSMQPSSSNQKMTIGNYFDNTTVYMGKYFGSAVYADALLHFSYYDPKSAVNEKIPKTVYENLLFQPELGLEIMTPFFAVRWSISPDSPESFFIADTSVTLSWKFSY
ncbi:MAG TPA: hypothetical protein GXZ47_08660 [Treponema sp.]|nr:hypothetical protein [Treponema sp.]